MLLDKEIQLYNFFPDTVKMYINVHCTYKYYQPLSTEYELDCSPIKLAADLIQELSHSQSLDKCISKRSGML